MKKAFPVLLLVLLAVAALAIKRCRNHAGKTAATVDRDHQLDRRAAYLEFTPHANCRTECLKVTAADITRVLESGEINALISDTAAKPCPIYAVEGSLAGNRRLRVIFAQCDFKTKVVSCLFIDAAITCACAGVGSRYDH